MDRRNQIPLLLVGALGVVAAAFMVLGILSVPNSGDISVQDGSAATFNASSFTLELTFTVSSGPGSGVLTQIRRITYSAPDHMAVYRETPNPGLLGYVNAAGIAKVLNGYTVVIQGDTPWKGSGSHFTRTESLVTFTARVSHKQSAQGEVFETALIHNGYLVYVNVKSVVPNQTVAGGGQAPGGVVGETFKVLSINGNPAP
jgi:hypothetical protein